MTTRAPSERRWRFTPGPFTRNGKSLALQGIWGKAPRRFSRGLARNAVRKSSACSGRQATQRTRGWSFRAPNRAQGLQAVPRGLLLQLSLLASAIKAESLPRGVRTTRFTTGVVAEGTTGVTIAGKAISRSHNRTYMPAPAAVIIVNQ